MKYGTHTFRGITRMELENIAQTKRYSPEWLKRAVGHYFCCTDCGIIVFHNDLLPCISEINDSPYSFGHPQDITCNEWIIKEII